MVVAIALWLNNRPADDVAIPTPPMPVPNARDDIERACALLPGRQHLFPTSMLVDDPRPRTLHDDDLAFGDSAPALAILHDALRKPYRAPSQRSHTGRDTLLAPIRELARSVASSADYLARTGRPGQAIDLLMDGLELGAVMPRGGGTMTALVGQAVERLVLPQVEELLPRLNPAELAATAARLDRIAAARVPYSEIVLEEGRATVACEKSHLAEVSPAAPVPFLAKMRLLAGAPPSGKPMSRAEASAVIRLTFASKSACLRGRLAYYDAVAEEVSGLYAGRVVTPAPDNPIMPFVGEYLQRGWRSHVSCQAVVDVLRVEVALLRYRADNGRYPDALGALAPRYLRSVPDDVCAGQPRIPLRYHVNDGGRSYVLYSVGPDMRDNAGEYLSVPTQGGDIVAGHLNGR